MLTFVPTCYWFAFNGEISFVSVLLNAVLILPVVILLYYTPKKWMKVIGITCVYVISLIELVFIIENGNYVKPLDILSILYHSNYESDELLDYGFRYIVPHFWLETVIYAVSITLSVYQRGYQKYRKVVIATSIVCIALLFSFFMQQMRYCSPYRISREVGCLIWHEHQRRILLPQSESMNYRAVSTDTAGIYVLAIGESMRYRNVSLNGEYERETMPKLQENDVILYSNCYSSALFTQQALPLLLTRATANSFEISYTEKPITVAFQQAGFKTYIVTNEAQIMVTDRYHYLTEGADSVIVISDDADAITELNKICTGETKAFVILHFLGNHMFYSNYPEEYNRWKPNYKDSKDLNCDSLFINAYDNSILYADYVLASCIAQLNIVDKPSVFVFTSDHGEYITESVGGHGASYNPIKDEYHIPLFVWCNESYKKEKSDKIRKANKHKDDPVCADHIFWSILDMAGVKIDEELQQEGMSIFGDTLLPHKRELLLPDNKSVIAVE